VELSGSSNIPNFAATCRCSLHSVCSSQLYVIFWHICLRAMFAVLAVFFQEVIKVVLSL
jgi:hypothetical protein